MAKKEIDKLRQRDQQRAAEEDTMPESPRKNGKTDYASRLRDKGDQLTNANYHSEAGLYYALAERLKQGEMAPTDGASILDALIEHEWF